MKYQKLDYRVGFLRAAAFHGSSHQAAMVFQDAIREALSWLGKCSSDRAKYSTHLVFRFTPES